MKKPSSSVIKFIFSFVVMLVAYTPIFLWMWDRWFSADSYYSHGILVPFVTLYFIWLTRKELAQTEQNPSPKGLIVIGVGFLLFLACALFRVYFAAAFSMLITLTGLIVFFFGTNILKKIFFPVCFLVFMVPLPEVAITNISFRLKIFAAEIAERLLNSMYIPAVRQGSVISMPHAQVVVDDVCSGLRSLISLTALASIFAYWIKGPFWKKIVLFVSSIPIAIITNVCRVIVLSAISEIWGAEYTHGLIHDATGFMVFGLAFILLYVVMRVME